MDLLIHFSAVNGGRGRCFDADSDLVDSDFQNNYFNCAVGGGKRVSDGDRLFESAGEYEHGGMSFLDAGVTPPSAQTMPSRNARAK